MARKGYRNVSIRTDVAQELSALAKREGLEISDMVNSLMDSWSFPQRVAAENASPFIGSSLDDLLAEDGTLDEISQRASERVYAQHHERFAQAQRIGPFGYLEKVKNLLGL